MAPRNLTKSHSNFKILNFKFSANCEHGRGQPGGSVPLLQALRYCSESTAGFQVCFSDEEIMEIKNRLVQKPGRTELEKLS